LTKQSSALFAVVFFVSILIGIQAVDLVDANPTWGKPATPVPPITDPPQIVINSPTPTEYNNPVPLNITIIQPDSWLTNHTFVLPSSYVDNSDSVVVGQNKLKSISCIIDGQSVILWNGTLMGSSAGIKAVTYYLPRITQFSAIMNLSKGQHSLQVNVVAASDYVVEGIIPFAEKEYIISANQSTTFRVEDGSDAPMIDFISSSYVIWQSSSDSMPSTTSAPQSLNPTQEPTTNPTSNSNIIPSPTQPTSPTPSPTPSTATNNQYSIPDTNCTIILSENASNPKATYLHSHNSTNGLYVPPSWQFENFSIGNGTVDLTVSANNCNLTITSFNYNTRNGSEQYTLYTDSWLNYTVEGKGNQTLDYTDLYSSYSPTRNLDVYIDGAARQQGDGWNWANFGLTIIGATSSVSIHQASLDYFPPRGSPHIEPIAYLLPISVILIAVIVLSLLLYRRHRKIVKGL
jgi:hypothetical protein